MRTRVTRAAGVAAALCLTSVLLVGIAGCGPTGTAAGSGSTETSGSIDASGAKGFNMAGASQTVVISKQALANKPKPWVLTTPESAVRSYLDWTSYAYRISESSVATPTMGAKEEVRVDSYIQFNLQKSKLLDQTLVTIKFGTPSTTGTSTLIPATEHWWYRYVSISEVGKTVGGPYSVDYESTYSVVKTKHGWVVDSVVAKALGEVK
jgi:hypothetical protein